MISIILTTHNSKKEFIEENIESILNQSYQDFEVLIVDDASKDECVAILEEATSRDERIKLYKQRENVGVSVNRNFGIENAKGEYITFVDDDDFLKADFLKKLLFESEVANADIVTCNFLRKIGFELSENPFNAESGAVYSSSGALEKVAAAVIDPKTRGTDINLLMLASAWGKMYKRSFLMDNKEVRFPEGMMGGEDAVFFIKALQTKNPPILKMISDALYVYRKNSDAFTVGFQPKLPEQNLERIRWFYKLSDGHTLMEKATKRNVCYAIMDMCSVYLADEKCPIKNKKKFLKDTLSQSEYKKALADLSELNYSFGKRLIYTFAKKGILTPVLLAGKMYRNSK